MAKQSKATVETKLNNDGSFEHTITFGNGQTIKYGVGKSHYLTQQFAAAGSKARILQTVNASKDSDDATKKVEALLEAFDDGRWTVLPESDPKEKFSPLVRAFAELKGVDLEEAQAVISKLSKAEQAKLRATARIATIIARLKGEGEGDATLDALLSPAAEVVEE